jgi:SIR2-like domain
MDGRGARSSRVRSAVTDVLRNAGSRPAPIHRALVSLADRGAATTIVTTNFDKLLEAAARGQGKRLQSYALGGIPRPGRSDEFAGVLHIHGVLGEQHRASDVIVTDQDFGEFYLRRRIVPDFIYDAARLFHLVLVGYSANDAPMRYLLNAVAADGSRFDDLRERFAFVGMAPQIDPVAIEDWKGRGITPIPYSASEQHIMLGRTLKRWAELSAINGRPGHVDSTLRRLIRTPRSGSTDSDRDLFDHLIRRSATNERQRMSAFISESGAGLDWLDAIATIGKEPKRERR